MSATKPAKYFAEFDSTADAHEFAVQDFEACGRMLDGSMISEAVEFYSGDGYMLINQPLRAGFEDEVLEDYVDKLDQFTDVPVSRNIVLYRGYTTAKQSRIAEHQIGATIIERGYMSTSLSREIAQSAASGVLVERRGDIGILYTIEAPCGARMGYLDVNTKYPTEQEALLARDSKLTVMSFDGTEEILGSHCGTCRTITVYKYTMRLEQND